MVCDMQVTTLAVFDGKKGDVTLGDPAGVAVDHEGHAIVADARNHCITKVISDKSGATVTTLAGKGREGNDDDQGAFAAFNLPIGVAVDGSGNTIVADAYNHRIRKITPEGMVSTVAGSGNARFAELASAVNEISSDIQERFFGFGNPRAVAVDSEGIVIVADTYMHRIRKIDTNGAVTTLAGSGSPGYADGKGTAACFNYPAGVAVQEDGSVLVADTCNGRIRKIQKDGMVTTLAGSMSGNMRDGHGFAASFNCPRGLAVDGDGNLIVADTGNHSIRMVTPDGIVTTLAGTGNASYSDGNGPGVGFSGPYDVAIDFDGNVLVADTGNRRLRLIAVGLNPTARRVRQMKLFHTIVAVRELIHTNRASLTLVGGVTCVPKTSHPGDSTDLHKIWKVLQHLPIVLLNRVILLL